MQQFLMPIRFLAAALGFCGALALGPATAFAQSLFSPAITVNEDIITYYELQQRERFLTLLRAPGDPRELAREGLIEDRLKDQATSAIGIEVAPEQIEAGMEEFAARANLGREEFIAALQGGGVSEETFRDFIISGVKWREYVRARFASRAAPSEAEIDRALAASGSTGGLRVLLSEIIMPATPETIDEVQARAQQIAQVRSFDAFSAQARQFSATNTRDNGGRMNWMPLTELPPQLRPLILGLAPGEVTAPIALPNAVALFQLRAIEETGTANQEYAAIEYAAYYIAGGRSEEALARAAELRGEIDTCDDLYAVAKDQPEEVLDRESLSPGELPRDIALELSKLDPGEVSTALTRADGQTLVFLMLCGRTAALNEDAARGDVATALTNQRLGAFAESHLSQLRADALILER